MRSFLKTIVAITVAVSPVYGSEPKASDVEVFVIVGENAIPLGVEHHFSDVSGALPTPGVFPANDTHDRQHHAKSFCYRFAATDHYELLEFFESDFGMHTARLSRVSALAGPECTMLSSQPKFVVNGRSFSLSAKELPKLPGFDEEKKKGAIALEREWTYSDPSRSHQWGICFSRSVSVEAITHKHGFRSITVMNWDEPGC